MSTVRFEQRLPQALADRIDEARGREARASLMRRAVERLLDGDTAPAPRPSSRTPAKRAPAAPKKAAPVKRPTTPTPRRAPSIRDTWAR